MPINSYGNQFLDGVSDAVIELQMAFDTGSSVGSLHKSPGFLGAFEHLQKATDLIFNQKEKLIIWNEWSELMFRAFIEEREIPITGPGASWKTTCAAAYAVLFCLADPMRTKVIGSSTSIGALREKLWKDISRFWRAARASFGNPVNHPHPKIQVVKGDDSCGIFGVAVEQGDTDSAVDRIKGRHAPRVLVIIDEGTGAQPAIVEACVNLSTGCDKYQLVMLANMSSYFNEFGKLAEPENGWSTVNVEHEKWRTRRGGLCIHLDGHKSPNVLAGHRKYPGLIAQQDLDLTAKEYGENSARYWIERRGFAPPEGIEDTVLSESMFVKFGCSEKPTWIGDYTLGAGLDPAYGGDRCCLRFGKCGMIHDKNGQPKWVIGLDDYKLIRIDATSKEPPHYQVARQVREECKARGVGPDMLAMDTTGVGDGTFNIFKREWSGEIYPVKFGGYASDFPVSDINPRPCKEEYANKVTELWFGFRVAVERGQIRGLDIDTAKEFCQRKADYKRYAPRSVVEPKSDMKLRLGRSPDLADAVVILVELFKRRMKEIRQNTEGYAPYKRWKEFQMERNVETEYALE